ncbi:MAG: type I DNA topoisomerase [Anaerolineae bacterium]
MSEDLLAYCVKCKTQRPVANPRPVFTRAARPATEGKCPVCGTTLYRMGATAAHEGLMPPDPAPARKAESAGRKKGAKTTGKRSRKGGASPRSGGKARKPAEGEGRRHGRLVIVESPAKARTIENYLGKDYRVRASVGHVRDLLKSQLSVDVEHDFAPRYRVPNDKREVVKELKAAAARAKEIYLATDPDREGEAIAWHLIHAAEIDESRVRRVVFYEITKPAVRAAFENPRSIDMNLVDAQQARRVLDRLVGYELSPLLWKKVRPRLSAGRVQSVAVRLIVEREREIQEFVPEEYWTIDADLARQAERDLPDRRSFRARLVRIHGEEAHIPSEEAVRPILADLEQSEYIVNKVQRGQRARKPLPPFTTSTMQQEASRRLGFTARRTMRVAQQLYEGVDIGNGGAVGLVTYIRTDSTNVSAQAQQEAREYVLRQLGEKYLPETPPVYGRASKTAQEAHESIRPTSVERTPSSLKPYLSRDQYRLYRMIWLRFMASQMADAIYDTIRVDIRAGVPGQRNGARPYELRASGSSLRFPGFLAIYGGAAAEADEESSEIEQMFPDLQDDDLLDLLALIPEQRFTQPPSRYTEATLVKTLEEYGIGRPSTYAPILNTIQQRGYVDREGKALIPTEIGMVVNDLLVKYFPEIVDVGFTAAMEADLDQIAEGEKEWVPVVRKFYEPFKAEVDWARKNVPSVSLGTEEIGRDCPLCGSPLVIRHGRYGKFIGCSDFPTCRYTEPWLERIGVTCPQCGGGEVVRRKTRKGRTFYGCSNYPECDFTSWKRPLATPCPECGGLLTVFSPEAAKCTVCQTEVRYDSLPREQLSEEERSATK